MGHWSSDEVVDFATGISRAIWGTRPELPARRRRLLQRLLRSGTFDGVVVTRSVNDVILNAFLVHQVGRELRAAFAGGVVEVPKSSGRTRLWVCTRGRGLPGDFATGRLSRTVAIAPPTSAHRTPTACLDEGPVLLGGAGRGTTAIALPTLAEIVVFEAADGHRHARVVK